MKLDFSSFFKKLEESMKAKEKKGRRRGERVPAYLRRCKYCKYIELIYCKFHAVTIHPESRACPAFVLREEFSAKKQEESGTV